MNWSDQQRAQLLQIYKDKIDSLGEEEFFTKFDEIRKEAHSQIVGTEPVSNESVQAGYAPGALTYKNGSLFPSELSQLDYVDPIHSSAATLGRLGGRARSEAKTTSSRSNGKKGGRPSVKQLDLEEI